MRRGIDGSEHLDRPPVKPLPTAPISFEEFLDWCDGETRAEWVNGRVVLMSPESDPHWKLVHFFTAVLGIYVQERNLGRVFGSNFMMKLDAIPSGRVPDLHFVTRERLEERIKHTHLQGAADMALEVVSPESVDRDEDEKFREYAEVGVREYWLINPMRRAAGFFELKSGRYKPLAIEDGVVRSRVIDGFFVRIDWLWNEPPFLDALRELGISKIVGDSLSGGSGGGR
jgi:Uma2 family endonuclease